MKTIRVCAALAAVMFAGACSRHHVASDTHPAATRMPGSPLGGRVFGPNATVVHSAAQHDSEAAQGFRWLFDGTSTSAWRGYHMDTLPTGWHIEDGVLVRTAESGDIVSRESFTNFELRFDWMLTAGGNSGVMYHVRDAQSDTEETYMSGPEYQLLDDSGYPDGRTRLTSAAADYGLYPSPPGVVRRPGQWNEGRIIINGAHVEHWLNGVKVVEYDLWSPDWTAKVTASKFHAWPMYGMSHSGHIALQEHPGRQSFRDIRIKVLP